MDVEEIIKRCNANEIALIQELEEWVTADMLRNAIHLNEKGHRFQAQLMKKYIEESPIM